jgi:hypothetical protein
MARSPDVSSVKASDPVAPRFATAWASLVYAVATLLLAYPALAGKFLVNILSDQYKIGYAFREYAAASLRSGQGFPKWNPFLFGGLPYVSAMHGDIFYPTFLLRMVLPTDVAMTWEFPIHLFLAGLFTYGFLRAWGFGFSASLIGGLAYMLSGQVSSLVSPGHDGKLFVSALFPAVLWLLVRGIRDGRAWSWGVLSIVVGLAILSPHPQLVQYMLLASGVFALYVSFGEQADGTTLPRPIAIRRLGFALGAVVLGGLISAIQYWPVLEYVPFSPRAGGRGYDYATSFSMPIEEIFNTYLPQFSGILENYWGRNNIHFHSEYIGAAVLVLMGAAFGATPRRGFRRFWAITGFVALVWALGGNTPFYHLVYAIVPGSKFFRAPSTIFFIVSFAVAALAAVGVERILKREVGQRYAIGWAIAAAVIALLISVGGGTALTQAVASSIATAYSPDQRSAVVSAIMERASGNSGALLAGAWRSFVVVAIAAGLTWALAMQRIAVRAAVWGFVALVTLDLWSIEHLYWNFMPPASKLYASDPIADYLASQKDPGRVLVLQIPQLPGLVSQDPMLTGCSGGTGGPALMVHRIRNVSGCHGNELGRYQQYGNYSDSSPSYDPTRFLSRAGARHENVRYLETNVADTLIGVLTQQLKTEPMTRILGPVKTAAGSTVYLYRVAGDNPFAWVAASMVKATPDQTLATVTSEGFDPGRAAILDTNTTVTTVPVTAVPQTAGGTATVTHYEPGAVDLTLGQPASAGQALVVSENYFPGWSAVVDGKPAPVIRADFNLMAVALPPGAKSVQLRFDDPAYEKGKALTLVALAVAIVLWGLGVVLDRRAGSRAVPA